MNKIKKTLVTLTVISSMIALASCDINTKLEELLDSDLINNLADSTNTTDSSTDSYESSTTEQTSYFIPSSETSYIEPTTTTESSSKYDIMAQNLSQYELDYTSLYGYNKLKNDSRYASYLTNVYETLYSSAHEFLISDKDYEVQDDYVVVYEYELESYSYQQLVASAWMTMMEENPLYYFLFTGYTLSKNEKGGYSFCLLAGDSYAKASDRYNCNLQILDMINDLNIEYSNLESNTDYDKALLVHDFICNRIDYAYDSDGEASDEYYAHNIIGVASKLGSVCESYAETYTFLATTIDLQSLVVVGYSGNTGHAWNYVNVDDTWYGLDATWDDNDTISYDYFLVSNTIMRKSHSPNSNRTYGIDYQVSLPTLSSTSYNQELDVIEDIPSYPGKNGGMRPRWFW